MNIEGILVCGQMNQAKNYDIDDLDINLRIPRKNVEIKSRKRIRLDEW